MMRLLKKKNIEKAITMFMTLLLRHNLMKKCGIIIARNGDRKKK